VGNAQADVAGVEVPGATRASDAGARKLEAVR
jgi:hypothetical protein